jgi:DNA repair protein RadC
MSNKNTSMVRNGKSPERADHGEEDDGKKTAGHEGHRKRLRERFEHNGLAALHPHEIIELILTYTIPRRDTKEMAHALLKRYKTLGALLNASPKEIQKVSGIGERSASHFRFVGEVMSYCLKERYSRQCVISHRHDVEEYLRISFGYSRNEYLAVLYLGNRNQVLETGIIAEGTVNQCTVHPRVIMEKALHYAATSLIIAHNHPGGGQAPSEADWLLTERLFEICRLMEIPLLDHLIISTEVVVSLKEAARWPSARKRQSP